MIKEIINNPFRILGLPANAKKKEIDLCYHKLLEGYNQQEKLTVAMQEIEDAFRAVISPEHHWHHASFWFVCISDKNRVNTEMKAMGEKHEGEYKSLREKVELRKNK